MSEKIQLSAGEDGTPSSTSQFPQATAADPTYFDLSSVRVTIIIFTSTFMTIGMRLSTPAVIMNVGYTLIRINIIAPPTVDIDVDKNGVALTGGTNLGSGDNGQPSESDVSSLNPNFIVVYEMSLKMSMLAQIMNGSTPQHYLHPHLQMFLEKRVIQKLMEKRQTSLYRLNCAW